MVGNVEADADAATESDALPGGNASLPLDAGATASSVDDVVEQALSVVAPRSVAAPSSPAMTRRDGVRLVLRIVIFTCRNVAERASATPGVIVLPG